MQETGLKIVADDKIPFLKGVLEPYAEVVYLPGAKITQTDAMNADAIFTRTRTRCDATLLAESSVKLIATATIGYDHIDVAYCDSAAIRWVNAPGCNSRSVQQYLTAALATMVYERKLKFAELTIGVIGAGNVGSKVAQAAEALGMRVLINDPPREEREGATAFTPLDKLLAESDIVTCHTPLSKTPPYPTWHLADDDFFAKMKDGAVFINTSRGAVTDTEALKRAAQRKLSAYILDVWEGEPAIDASLLEGAFIGTPHIAGYSVDGKANGTAVCVNEFCRFFGLDVLHEWRPTDIPPPPMSALITLDGAQKSVEQLIYEVVTHTYPIREDSERLKLSPETFEEQRGSYWKRREFDYFTVALEKKNGDERRSVDPEIICSLQKLGFKILETRQET